MFKCCHSICWNNQRVSIGQVFSARWQSTVVEACKWTDNTTSLFSSADFSPYLYYLVYNKFVCRSILFLNTVLAIDYCLVLQMFMFALYDWVLVFFLVIDNRWLCFFSILISGTLDLVLNSEATFYTDHYLIWCGLILYTDRVTSQLSQMFWIYVYEILITSFPLTQFCLPL